MRAKGQLHKHKHIYEQGLPLLVALVFTPRVYHAHKLGALVPLRDTSIATATLGGTEGKCRTTKIQPKCWAQHTLVSVPFKMLCLNSIHCSYGMPQASSSQSQSQVGKGGAHSIVHSIVRTADVAIVPFTTACK